MTKDQMQKELETLKRENKALQKQISELIAENEKLKAAKPDPADGCEPPPDGKIGILLGAICQSCADHCPHHQDEDACRNCNIYKSVFNAGYKINRPEPAQEV